MRDLRATAKRLGGEVSGGAISCPGPGHSRFDRSLRVFIDSDALDGFTVTSFAGDDWRACRDYVAHRLGIELWRPSVERRERLAPRPRAQQDHTSDHTRELALRIWGETKPISGTIAETYLSKRIGLKIEWPADLRFHPKCPRGEYKLPALVALLRDIRSDEPTAIQRIFLRDDGTDRLRDYAGKMTLGPASGAVCKLSPCANVTYGLGIAEGIESGLAIFSQGWRPIWITCGTSGMKSFPVLAGINSFSAFADHDMAGQAAARECAQRWADAGVQSRIITPKIAGADWADMVAA